jgi:hypothetical protein
MRNVDGSFFGKSPNGETCKFEKGGSKNGPAILPAYNNSLATLSETISGIASADGRLRQFKVILKSKHETENPCVNPFTT